MEKINKVLEDHVKEMDRQLQELGRAKQEFDKKFKSLEAEVELNPILECQSSKFFLITLLRIIICLHLSAPCIAKYAYN